jgi:hypothetical protein
MNTKLRSLLLAILITLCVSTSLVSAQTDPLAALPTSDVVLHIDARRIQTEIIPRLLANDPATLAKMTAMANEVQTKTGVNVLGIDRIVIGFQLLGPLKPGFKKDDAGIAIIVSGNFNPSGLIEFAKREGKGKTGEETYGGKVIYSEPRPDPPRVKSERETAAVTLLDANTLVLGDLPQVRAAIDAASGKGRVDAALVQLAMRDSSSLIAFAGNVPPSLAESMMANAPSDPMAQGMMKLIATIKQIFASVGSTPTDFNMIMGVRLGSVEQAQSISDMLLGIRQQVGSQIPDPKARDILNTLQITAQNDEVQIRADVKNEVVQSFIAEMMKEKKKEAATAAKPATTKTKKSTKSRRGRRRRSR